MKGKAKRLASLLLVLVLMLSSTIIASADNSTTIQRDKSVSTSTALAHTEVSVASDTTDRGTATLAVKNSDDTFDMYRVVDITPVTSSGTSITELSFSWVKPVQDFINANDDFKNDADYSSPEKLGAFQKGEDLTGNDQSKIIKLFRALKEDETTMNALKTGHTVLPGDVQDPYYVAAINATKVDGLVNGSILTTENANAISYSKGATPNEKTLAIKTAGSGDPLVISSYTLENVPFGIYFLDVKNAKRVDNGGYQPVVIDMVPEQTGPSGHWYMDNTRAFQVKNEGLKLSKKINGTDMDQVGIGDIVTFTVEFQVPDYPKNLSGASAGQYMYDWFNAFDASTKGFTLIPSSAVLTYFDRDNNEYHPHATLSSDKFNNLTANDLGGQIKYVNESQLNPTQADAQVGALLTAENTYTAYLLPEATPYVSSADSAANKKVYFWTTPEDASKFTVWTQNNGELVKVTNGISAIDSNVIYQVNTKRDSEDPIPTSYTATTFGPLDYTQSLLGISFNYPTLMDEATYEANAVAGKNETSFMSISPTGTYNYADRTITEKREAAFTHPDRVVINYDAIINDQFEVGNDNNSNTAYLNYIIDTNGTRSDLSETVKAWTYGINLIKADGEQYTVYETADPETQAAMEADPKRNPFLEGAKFDVYKFDTEYCGGEDATTEPIGSARESYVFYNDVDTPAVTGDEFAKAMPSETRAALAKKTYATAGRFYKALRYEITDNKQIRDPATVGIKVATAYQALGNWDKASTFTNKYNFAGVYTAVSEVEDYNMLTDYMYPHTPYMANSTTQVDWKAAEDFTSGGKAFVQYVPEEVESCDFHAGKHYHLKAYALVYADITSNDTANGINVKGLDYGQYIMVESKAPEGYNNLDSQIYFEINKYGDTEYTAAGSSYKGFLTDEYEHDDSEVKSDNWEDGYYPFLIKNYTGLTLPSTGGMGTLLFTIIGIIVMISAIIFVIMKNKKIAKNAAAFMMAALMVAGTFAGLIATPITSEAAKIINTQDDGLGGNSSVVKATETGKAEFTVWLNSNTDELEIYQIASTTFSSGGWTDPAWVNKVDKLMLDNTNGFEVKTGFTCPTDPKLYADAETEVQTAFLSWIYETKDISLIDAMENASVLTISDTATPQGRYKATIKNVPYGIYLVKAKSASGKEYQSLLLSAVPQERGPSGGWYVTGITEAYLKYSDVQIIKKINGKDSDVVRDNEKVTFTIIAEVPEYQPITYEKKDELGNLIADVITDKGSSDYINYDWNKYYKYAITDIMSDAFYYDPTVDTIKIEYSTVAKEKVEDAYTAGDMGWTVVPSTGSNYEMLFADAFDTVSTSPTYNTGVKAFKSSTDKTGKYMLMNSEKASASTYTCTWYLYDSKKGTIVKYYTDSSVTSPNTLTPSTLNQTEYRKVAGLEASESLGTISPVADFGDFMGITFDYRQLHRGYSADPAYLDKGEHIVRYIKLTYTSSVTDECLTGVETNTNTAYVWFRTDVAGDYDKIPDEVRAYTYGLNLVKIDGTTADNATPTYLKDAKFQLYKEAYIFVPYSRTQVTAPANSAEYEEFKFVAGADNDEYRGVTRLRKDDALKTIIGIEAESTYTATLADFDREGGTQAGLQYYFRYVPVELAAAGGSATECTVSGCPVTNDTAAVATHYHVHVYNQMTLENQTSVDATEASGTHNDVLGNEIRSTNTAAGVTITGLEDASYVIIETAQPTGYNPLTEAMRFEIHTLSDTQKKLSKNAEFTTDKTFVSSTVVADATGKTDVVYDGKIEGEGEGATEVYDGYKMYQGYSNGVYGVTVKNYKGLTLPSTGGMGTLLFTIIGIVVMLVAMMIVIAKNKKAANYM